jgi:MraZ protein
MQRMDGKGRLIIPAQFRDALRGGDPGSRGFDQTRMIVNYGDHLQGHIRIYSIEGFAAVDAMIKALPAASTLRRNLSYIYLTQSEPFAADKEGRIILGADLRAKLGFDEGEVRFLGLGDHIEAWNEAVFQAGKGAEVAAWLATMPAGVDPLSLAAEMLAAQAAAPAAVSAPAP